MDSDQTGQRFWHFIDQNIDYLIDKMCILPDNEINIKTNTDASQK